MSETLDNDSGNVHEIPGPERFNVRGQSFQLDLLETIYCFRDIGEEVQEQGGDHRAYLMRLTDFVQRETGVLLTFGEVDWLNDHLEIAFAAAKKKRRDSIVAARNSPSSTASTPAD